MSFLKSFLKYVNPLSCRDFTVLKYRKTFIEDVLDVRAGDRERCNMLLLLLVVSILLLVFFALIHLSTGHPGHSKKKLAFDFCWFCVVIRF